MCQRDISFAADPWIIVVHQGFVAGEVADPGNGDRAPAAGPDRVAANTASAVLNRDLTAWPGPPRRGGPPGSLGKFLDLIGSWVGRRHGAPQHQGEAGAPLIRNGTVTMLDVTPSSLRSLASMRPSWFRSGTTFGASLKMPS